MAKFRKKPVVIEAIQFTGENQSQINKFTDSKSRVSGYNNNKIEIETLEGVMTASINDFIIKGVNGEFYPCKPDIFEKTYEKAE